MPAAHSGCETRTENMRRASRPRRWPKLLSAPGKPWRGPARRQSSMRKETVTAAGEPGHAAARTPPGATAAVASGHIARLLRIVVSAL